MPAALVDMPAARPPQAGAERTLAGRLALSEEHRGRSGQVRFVPLAVARGLWFSDPPLALQQGLVPSSGPGQHHDASTECDPRAGSCPSVVAKDPQLGRYP
jgi:hypothetical protein